MTTTRRPTRAALGRSYDVMSRRLTPERTRRATLVERMTVGRMPWELLVQTNRAMEFVGRLATGILTVTIALAVLGVNVRSGAQDALNSGRPLQGVLGFAVLFPVLGFLALRSAIGFLRWRIQRELWRRDVARLAEEAS